MYHHTQIGWVLIAIITPVILVMGIWSVLYPMLAGILTAIAMLVVLILFGSLTVKGDNQGLSFFFGPGLIKKQIAFRDIQSAKKVRNSWYYGWGIRWFGRGWLYNVSGLDAIELRLRSGRTLRIGTDEPEALINFISRKMSGG